MKACIFASEHVWPGFSTTQAWGSSPASLSGTEVTPASTIDGCVSNKDSNSDGATYKHKTELTNGVLTFQSAEPYVHQIKYVHSI